MRNGGCNGDCEGDFATKEAGVTAKRQEAKRHA